jgi:hypothetical protein
MYSYSGKFCAGWSHFLPQGKGFFLRRAGSGYTYNDH